MPDDTRSPKPPSPGDPLVPRRQVLKFAGSAIAVAALPAIEGCAADSSAPEETTSPPESDLDAADLANALTVDVVRKEDLVILKLAFVNLDVRNRNSAAPPAGLVLAGDLWLGKTNPQAASYIVAIHPPQHIFEEAFDEGKEIDKTQPQQSQTSPTANVPDPNVPYVRHRMAEPSRLAFRVPANVTAIPYELPQILAALASYPLNVVSTATPQPPEQSSLTIIPLFSVIAAAATNLEKSRRAVKAARVMKASLSYAAENPEALPRVTTIDNAVRGIVPIVPTKPNDMQTSIELPWRLQISPNVYARFVHSPSPVKSTATKRVELWHTRLQTKEAWQQTIRAVWTRDIGFSPDNYGVTMQGASTPITGGMQFYGDMFPKDRNDIVHLSTNLTLLDTDGHTRARAVPTKSLALSALGGWLEAHGAWKNPAEGPMGGPSLVNWDHFATMGRDHFVRVVRFGYLYPYGHPAVWVRISERKFRKPWDATAYVWTRQFVVVTQPLKTYEGIAGRLVRGLPFKSLRFKTVITPLLAPMSTAPVGKYSAFPCVGNAPFRFDVQGFDHDGNAHDFTTACIWVDAEDAYGSGGLAESDAYREVFSSAWEGNEQWRKVDLRGQRVSFAESDDVDDTRYSAGDMLFVAAHVAGGKGVAPFTPQLETATIAVDTIQGLSGANQPTAFAYHPKYLDYEFAADATYKNPGAVFMYVVGEKAKLEFHHQSQKSGGFVAPSLAVSALSRKQGIVGGHPDDFAKSDFKPAEFFGGIKAKLFGVLDLFDIVAAVGGDKLFEQAPKFLTQGMEALEKVLQIVQGGDSIATLVKSQIAELKGVLSYLPANFATVPDKQREALVAALAGLSESQKGLLLRVWYRAAALGETAASMANLADALSTAVDGVNVKAAQLASALDLVPTVTEATAPQLIDQIATALGGARDALATVAPLLKTSPVPIDDGARAQLASAADKILKLVDPGAPQALLDAVTAFVTAKEAVKNLHVKLEWAPELRPWPDNKSALFWPKDRKGLKLGVEARGKASGGQPAGAEVYASLVDFELRLLGEDPFLKLVFDKLIFKAGTAGKPEIDCVFRGLHFGGPLEFVETLRSFIPLDGFSDPPNVLVDESGLRAKFTLPLPNIAVGVFSLENLSFSAGFEIPFIGESLSVSFSFCSREEPFALTVCMLGGGGFFAIHITPDGVRMLEIALEARAALSLDFGVASGSISVALGLYFAIENDDCTLTGYLRMRGEVDVLGGLISASIELYLELTYESATGKVTGYAMIEISVHVIVFTGTVKVECERKFSGGNGDPTFRELMYDPITGYAPWEEYCDAFAA